MRTTRIVLVSALLALGLLMPSVGLARPPIVVGSLTITGSGGAALATQLVGFAVVANPGLEKTITQQIPPFVLPVVVAGTGSSSLDTTLVLTNTTPASLAIELTIRDEAGTVLAGPVAMTLAAYGTEVVVLSTLIP